MLRTGEFSSSNNCQQQTRKPKEKPSPIKVEILEGVQRVPRTSRYLYAEMFKGPRVAWLYPRQANGARELRRNDKDWFCEAMITILTISKDYAVDLRQRMDRVRSDKRG